MARIFISHSSLDNEPSRRLKAWLESEGFEQITLDVDDKSGIQPGEDWEKALYRGIETADAVILILTPNWQNSKWCFAEFTQARALGKAIFPIIEAPTGETVVVSDIQHLDLTRDREGGLQKLSRALKSISSESQFAWDAARPPYPGLLSYQSADAAIFFGRDEEIRQVIERLNARRVQGGPQMLTLLGASGSGKSSLLRAGIVPRLQRDAHNWIVLPAFRPQRRPMDELARAIASVMDAPDTWRTWRTRLGDGTNDHALDDLAADLRVHAKANEAHILIVIDQAEETFATANAEEAEAFLRILSLATSGDLPFIVIAALRSDFLANLQTAKPFTARFETILLKPMPIERVPQILRGPAKLAKLKIDDDLVIAATRDAATEDALPLLAFTLRVLYERFSGNGELTLRDYRALGDETAGLTPLENAVRQTADEVVAALNPSPDQMAALRQAFIPAMVRVNDEGDYARCPAAWSDLPQAAHPLLQALASARLLVVRQEADTKLVEVAHEALLRKWPLLRSWLDEEREFLIGHQQLTRDLAEWRAAPEDRKNSALLTGLKLTRGLDWLQHHGNQLNGPEQEFIRASAERESARRRKREAARRLVVIGTAAAAAMLAVAALVAGWQWFEADEATRRAEAATLRAKGATERVETERDRVLVAQSRFLGGLARAQTARGDVVSGMLVALEALPDPSGGEQRPYVPDAERALYQGFHAARERFVLVGPRHEHSNVDRTPGFGKTVYLGSGTIVTAARFSPDGTQIATASSDQTARLWDARTGEQTAMLTGHERSVVALAYSPDGARLATVSFDGKAIVWDTRAGKSQMVLDGPGKELRSVVFSRDGKRILAGDGAGFTVWNAMTGDRAAGPKIEGPALALSPDGSRLAARSGDGAMAIWNAQTGEKISTLSPVPDKPDHVRFSDDGELLLVATNNGDPGLFDTGTGSLLRTLDTGGQGPGAVEFDRSGGYLATAGPEKSASVWNLSTGSRIAVLKGHSEPVDRMAFSPDGTIIATASPDRAVRLWDRASGETIAVLAGHDGPIKTIDFTPDGGLVVTASADGTARVWQVRRTLGTVALVGHDSRVMKAGWRADGTGVTTQAADGAVWLWDAATGERARVVYQAEKTHGVVRAVNAADDRAVTMADESNWGSEDYDGRARLWNLATGEMIAELKDHEGQILDVAFSPGGGHFITGSVDGTVRIWDEKTGKPLALLDTGSDEIGRVAFSIDGRRAASADWADENLRIWDLDTGAEIARAEYGGAGGRIAAMAFTPDGARLLTASEDRTIRAWNAETGAFLTGLDGPEGAIVGLAIASDGKQIAGAVGNLPYGFASTDYSGRVWRPAGSGIAETARLLGHTDSVNSVAFSPGGDRIVTASSDGTARIWTLFSSTEQLVSEIRQGAPRCLDPAQRRQFFLEAAPPAWCIEMNKWPYQGPAWKDWLKQTRAGQAVDMPGIEGQ